jgi:signal transduction histidine kinase
MSLRDKPASLLSRLAHPKTTVRWRLTLLYGGLFLVLSAALLAITYTLVSDATVTHGGLSPQAISALPSHLRPGPPGHERLVKAATNGRLPAGTVPSELRKLLSSPAGQAVLRFVGSNQRITDLHQLVIESGIALAIMAIISTLLGWVIAGRVLHPLRTITATTQQISEANLHERLAMQGPRDELRKLADTIDGLLERLGVAFDAQRRFVANASHELRTPLAMMRTSLDVAVAKPEGVPPQLQALDSELREDLDHADRLLESFLVLARAQHGALTDQSSVPLERIVTAALEARSDAIVEQQIEVQTALAPVRVTGGETLLSRMVENVIENAVRYNQPHGFINVTSEIHGEAARLVVESDGPVLDQRSVAELAQPFRRLGAERTRSENGLGLGLSIVAAVAAAHGGALDLHARPQGGLRVQITLPSATLAQPAGARG